MMFTNRRSFVVCLPMVKPNKFLCKKTIIMKFILFIIISSIIIASWNNRMLQLENIVKVDSQKLITTYEQGMSSRKDCQDQKLFEEISRNFDSLSQIENKITIAEPKINTNTRQTNKIIIDTKKIDVNGANATTDTNEEMKTTDKKIIDSNVNLPDDTHPLENQCKYGILQPWDKSLMDYMTDPSNITCDRVLPDIIKFQNGKITVDQEVSMTELKFRVVCKYRSLGGTLYPAKDTPQPIGEWVNLTKEWLNVSNDQIEVQCYKDSNESQLVYKFAMAHIIPKLNQTFVKNTEDMLSVSIIEIDSASRNSFMRHMPLSFEYLTKELNAFDLRGFMKVADNTLPNLLPVLTGLRYLNLSADMPSDFPLGKPIDLDTMPLLWKEYQDKGCATMLNDDPVNVGFGFLQYPTPEYNGFHLKPTTHWFRPFYIFNRRYPPVGYPNKNVSKLCLGNKFGFDYQLEFHEQMSMLYNDTCHFTFTSIAELAHDDCSNLELMDLKLKQLVQRLHQSNALNKSVLVIMGDHGQRVNLIRHEFVARIEERMPLFTIVFPEWFRKKHPKIMNNLRLNQNRLISNFDLYHILKDVSDGSFDVELVNEKFPRQSKGLSPLHNIISKNRTCQEALIPENHCACLIPHKKILPDDPVNKLASDLIKNYTQKTLENFTQCQKVEEIKMISIARWTLNQMVQHGVRLIEPNQIKMLNGNITGHVEYIEVEYTMVPTNISALIRIQRDLRNKLFFVNSDPPLVLNGKFGCKNKPDLPLFCKCTEL